MFESRGTSVGLWWVWGEATARTAFWRAAPGPWWKTSRTRAHFSASRRIAKLLERCDGNGSGAEYVLLHRRRIRDATHGGAPGSTLRTTLAEPPKTGFWWNQRQVR